MLAAVSIAGFELPFDVMVLGLITGMTYGILAVGLVLIYRSNRIINFAHGEIGAFSAAVLGLVVNDAGVPYWLAFPFALLVGGGIGAISEITVVRRLRNAPAIMSLVATLGLAQFLLLMSVVVNAGVSAGRTFPQPEFLPEFNVGALLVTHAYTAMAFGSPLVVLGLVLFLRRSRYGLAIRASAANRDAARLSGVFATRMSTLSWAIAGGVSAFTAILVLPTRGFTGAEFLGPGLLLRALVAAVAARLNSLPIALGVGVGVGLVEQLLIWNYPRGGLIDAVLFVAILGALLLQRRQGGREAEQGSWTAVQPWPALPDSLRQLWSVRNLGRIVGLGSLAVALLLPIFVTNANAITLVVIMAFALVGLSLGIVTGLGGQLSLGQFALAGVGATASYVVAFNTGNYFLAFLVAGLAAAAVSLVIGLPALRISGLLLAVTTLAFALAAQGWLFQQSWMLEDGVNPGRPILPGGNALDTGKKYYFVAVVVLAVGVWLSSNVWRGGIGRRLRAIRDNEDGARAFTIPATAVKLQGFAISGFLAGLGGAVYGHALSQIASNAFPIDANIDTMAMTVLGGIGVLAGPLLGALYIIGVPEFIPLDNAGLAATSLGWLLLVLYFPGGIAQTIRPLRDRVIDGLARRAGLDPVELRNETPAGGGGSGVRIDALPRPEPPRQPDAPVLAVEGMAKSFGGIQAVQGVSFEVMPGETLGLIGPNGAGKTTLFELVGGFQDPDAGRVVFDGVDVSRMGPEQRGQLGLIRSFQDARLFPTMTVAETVQLSLERAEPTRFLPSLLGARKAEKDKEQRALEFVEMMGLHSYRNSQISSLSTGTRRITEIACLLAMQPKVLLLDEPAAGIAQRESEALADLLERLKVELGLTLVIIEHDIPMIMRLADRIVAMDLGEVIADGDPAAVRHDPRVVESYLGGDSTAIERSGTVDEATLGDSRSDEPDRCTATTKSGDRCARSATVGDTCRQHEKVGV